MSPVYLSNKLKMKEQLFFSIIGIAIILITILLIIPFVASFGEYAREPMSNGILEGLTSLLLCILFSVAAFIYTRFNTRFKFNAADEAADQLTEFELTFANGESFNYSFEDNPMQENGYYTTLRTVKGSWNFT